MVSLAIRRKPCKNVPINEYGSLVCDHTVEYNVEIVGEKPPSRKSKKERDIKQKSKESKNVEFTTHLARMVEDRNLCTVERRAAIMNVKLDRKE